jgi:hypothetical protein
MQRIYAHVLSSFTSSCSKTVRNELVNVLMKDNAIYLREKATTPHCRDRGHHCLLVQVIEDQSLAVCDSKDVTSDKTSEKEWRQMVMVGEIKEQWRNSIH